MGSGVIGKFIGVTGVSGSGKSSLINKILAPYLQNELNRAQKKIGKITSYLVLAWYVGGIYAAVL